ncbi:olfactory receptor 14K1-like [Tachyglossus aculeatus]|uniref:olfactory receptor 14K1-like n=1 Tax=Tachyglossus aculeatus TaxID=9261 RepID=UPI0018F327F8|nr:olfactory receptor 14K1-like [Tachyglossus aculeatus]
MPASESQAKVFSTCLTHFDFFTVFLSMAIISYLKPGSDSPSTLDLLVSMFNTVAPVCARSLLNSVILPKFIYNSLSNSNPISFLGCIAQLFLWILPISCSEDHVAMDMSITTGVASISFLGWAAQIFSVVQFGGSEIFIITAMPYDRYVAIRCLLGYELVMNQGACGNMAAASRLTGTLAVVCFMSIVVSYACIFRVVLRMPPMEGRAKAFTTCVSQLVVITVSSLWVYLSTARTTSPSLITCSQNHVAIVVSVTIGSCLGFVCLVSIKASYASILSTVQRIPSADSWSKAFSTCLPPFLVVTVFLTTSAFDHVKPPSETFPTLDFLVSVFYIDLRNHVTRGFSRNLAHEVHPKGPRSVLQGSPSDQ